MASRCPAVFVFGNVACRRFPHRSGRHRGVLAGASGTVAAISWQWGNLWHVEVVKLTGHPGGAAVEAGELAGVGCD